MMNELSRRLARSARWFGGAAMAIGVATLAATSPGCSDGSESTPRRSPCPPGQTCQARLTLLHTADIHSRLLPYDLQITQVDANLGLGSLGEVKNVGGVARLSYLLGRERAKSERALHLSGGDCFQGAPIFNFFQGEPEIRAVAAMGTDAMAIANHEFDLGPLNIARQMQRWGNFPVLAANYKFEQADRPGNNLVQNIVKAFKVFTLDGLKVGVIGMGNLSSMTSLFDQPNRLGIQPLNTAETAQFYIDLLRPLVDVVVFTTHLGLEVDQRMIRNTTGIDVVLGSHNHLVLNPPQSVTDCSADPTNPGYVWAVDPNLDVDPEAAPPNDALHPDPVYHPWQFRRVCKPRPVVLAHSGAFAKYLGRLDLVLSNEPSSASPTGNAADYDANNGFEVVSSKYVPFPVDETIPEDPILKRMLEPYARQLNLVADLDTLVGFSPFGSRRISPNGGDSPLGNLVATAMWLRLGVQTDFSMTNSTGVRADLLPGPITVEQMYNIFPFDNSVAKMQLSGGEVYEMFDFVARRSAGRGCSSQVQVAGARMRINCAGCNRPGARTACREDADCPGKETGACEKAVGLCIVNACAEQVYIGTSERSCNSDEDCIGPDNVPRPGSCNKKQVGDKGRCMVPINPTGLYELATSNYLASGGSGFRVLQRNTTQFDTKIQQRDALVDFIRQGRPCGYRKDAGTPEGLVACETDADCAGEVGGTFVCACPRPWSTNADLTCRSTTACSRSEGRCVRQDCRDQVAQFHAKRCADNPKIPECRQVLDPCSLAGESCKVLSCVDESLGAYTDNRIQMIGR